MVAKLLLISNILMEKGCFNTCRPATIRTGSSFLHKRNRNIIVEVGEDEELEVKEGYIWASLGQIKELLRYPNVVNMDSRTVISCINLAAILSIHFAFGCRKENEWHT